MRPGRIRGREGEYVENTQGECMERIREARKNRVGGRIRRENMFSLLAFKGTAFNDFK